MGLADQAALETRLDQTDFSSATTDADVLALPRSPTTTLVELPSATP